MGGAGSDPLSRWAVGALHCCAVEAGYCEARFELLAVNFEPAPIRCMRISRYLLTVASIGCARFDGPTFRGSTVLTAQQIMGERGLLEFLPVHSCPINFLYLFGDPVFGPKVVHGFPAARHRPVVVDDHVAARRELRIEGLQDLHC